MELNVARPSHEVVTGRLLIPIAHVTLNKLCELNQILLYKVAAHTGTEGNEKVDELEKAGASYPPVGPEPFLCIRAGAKLEM